MLSARGRLMAAGIVLFLVAATVVPWGVHAGTAAAPEVTDNPNDVQVSAQGQNLVPACASDPVGCPTFARVDIAKAWIANETSTAFHVIVLVGGDASAGNNAYGWKIDAHFSAGGKNLTATATATGGPSPGAPAASGAATAVVGKADGTLDFTIPKSAIGAATGPTVTGIFVEGFGLDPAASSTILAYDRAPDSAFGTAYSFTMGGGGNATTTSHPANSTTTAPANHTSTTSTSASPTSATSGTATTTTSHPSSTTTTPAASTSAKASCDASNDLGGCFKGDNGTYIIAAGALFLLLIVVALIALLGRWAV